MAPWGLCQSAGPFPPKGDSPSARAVLFAAAQEQLLSGASTHPISKCAESSRKVVACVFVDRCRGTQGFLLPATEGHNCQEESLQGPPCLLGNLGLNLLSTGCDFPVPRIARAKRSKG